MFTLGRVVSPTYNGSGHSLAVTVNNSSGFAILVPVCSTADLSSPAFSVQVRIHDLGGALTLDVMNMMFFSGDSYFTPAGWITPRIVGTDTWFQVTGGLWPSSASYVGLFFSVTNNDSWNGTVYLDNLTFQ